jgi:hypothetical protein
MKSELFICEFMMVFNTLISYFHKNSLHYFKDYLMMKLTLAQGM